MRKLFASLVLIISILSSSAAFFTNDISGGTTRASITNAISLMSIGDTLIIQNGTYYISQSITSSMAISIIGQSSNSTVLVDSIPRNANYFGVFYYGSATNNAFISRISNMKFTSDGTNTGNSAFGILTGNIRSQLMVFDHLWFDDIHARPANFYNNSTSNNFGGLFKYCTFTTMHSHGFFWDVNALSGGKGNGYYEWAHPVEYGSTNGWWYIEDCYAFHPTGTAFQDSRGGSKYCLRSNILENVSIENHELDHAKLGPRAMEIYGNTFIGSSVSPKNDAVYIRAGTALITGNSVGSGWTRLLNMVNFRSLSHSGSSPNGASWGLFGTAAGTNVWDDNYSGPYGLPTNITGTVSGASPSASNRILVDTNTYWATNDYWKGYTVINTSSGRGGLILSSTSNSITLYDPLVPGGETYFTNGNTYKITQVRQAFNQPGSGLADQLCCGTQSINATPTGWPHEATEPIHYWNNTGITAVSPDVYGKLIVAGVHYTNTAYPGWVPLVYPHPLWTYIQGGTPPSPPTITTIADQTIGVSTNTATLSFTIGSGQTNVANYTMSYSSTLTSLVPNSATNVVFGGSGVNRTVKIYPVTGQSGDTVIALTVTDETGAIASSTFHLTVANANTPPNISNIDNQNISPSFTTGALAFTVSDFESNATNLVVTRLSSNTGIIPLASVVLAGTSTNRTVTVASGTNVGFSTITLTVTDPGGKTNFTQFIVTVSPPDPSGLLFRGSYRRRAF